MTFHLDERFVANLTFAFPNLAEPSWQQIELSFVSDASTDNDSNTYWIALLGVGALVLVVGATVFMTLRRRESQ